MENPLISCIMPVYNGEKFLRPAIESILNQTYKHFELIIINDGSTDNTENIILSYNDERIRYVKNECNLKLIKTLNKGIDIAKGEYISRMDADDIALPTLFEEEVGAFEQYKDVGMINTLTFHLSEDGKHIRKNRLIINLQPNILPLINGFQNMISHPGVMVKSELMKKYRYRDNLQVLHLEDYDLWLRFFKDGIICHTLDKRLLYYRTVSTSINALYENEREYRRRTILAEYLKTTYNYQVPPSFKTQTLHNIHGILYYHYVMSSFWGYCYKNKILSLTSFISIKRYQVRLLLFHLKNFVFR